MPRRPPLCAPQAAVAPGCRHRAVQSGGTVGAGRSHGGLRSARAPLVRLRCLPALWEGMVRGWWSADRRFLPFSAREAVVAFSTRVWSGSFLPSNSGTAVPIPK